MIDADTADWTTGYVQVYTGSGKGKTTAALGLAMRAAGAGLRVFIGQFMKGMHYSELNAIGRLRDLIDLEQFGGEQFIRSKPTRKDIERARHGLERVASVLTAAHHRLVILDEANVAVHVGLISVDDLLKVIEMKPPAVELLITGRRAHERILERAHLVTEMRNIKHYYSSGVQARRGIEN